MAQIVFEKVTEWYLLDIQWFNSASITTPR